MGYGAIPEGSSFASNRVNESTCSSSHPPDSFAKIKYKMSSFLTSWSDTVAISSNSLLYGGIGWLSWRSSYLVTPDELDVRGVQGINLSHSLLYLIKVIGHINMKENCLVPSLQPHIHRHLSCSWSHRYRIRIGSFTCHFYRQWPKTMNASIISIGRYSPLPGRSRILIFPLGDPGL